MSIENTSPRGPLAHELKTELKRGIIAQHVTHLDDELLPRGVVQQPAESRQRLACGLVEMDVFARGNATRRGGHEILHGRLHCDRLQARRVEQLLLGHPGETRVCLALLRRGSPASIGLNDADDLEFPGVAHGRHLPRSMRVAGADLADANLGRLGVGLRPCDGQRSQPADRQAGSR